MRTNSSRTLIVKFLRLITALMMLVGAFGFLGAGTVFAADAIIYIKADASGADDGTSWTDAYTSLQSALSASISGDQLWVAAGTYYPTTGVDRNATFTLKNGVRIYGGFNATETQLTDRDPATNITILSGDIGISRDISDNSYHVVTGGGTDNSAMLDGFTVTGGNADLIVVNSPDQFGGGMYNAFSSPTLSNIVFSGNTAKYGGGMYNEYSSPMMANITFSDNSATRAGGMYNLDSNPTLRSVTFVNNSAFSRGGGMTSSGSSPSLTNVTFSGNSAPLGAGMHNVYDSDPILTNVTFSGNSATTNGGAMFNESSNPIITNSILYGNSGGEIFNSSSTPVVDFSIVQGGYPGIGNLSINPLLGPLQDNGGFTKTMALLPGSPAINTGSNANCPETDQRGVSRPQGNQCDIGAYEYQAIISTDTTGVFRPSNGALYLKNSNTTGYADIAINYGMGGDYPVTGDWDGDGTDTIGIYRNGAFYLRNSNTIGYADMMFAFGSPGDQPVAGDWNGDGIDTIGVYRSSTFTFYLRNSNTSGPPEMIFSLGVPGDVGIAGDWDGDGLDTTGVFRPSNGALYLKNTNATGYADIAINYGIGGDQPVTGDWNNDGVDTIGVYRGNTFYLRNSNSIGYADMVFALGVPGDMPIAGNWDGLP